MQAVQTSLKYELLANRKSHLNSNSRGGGFGIHSLNQLKAFTEQRFDLCRISLRISFQDLSFLLL